MFGAEELLRTQWMASSDLWSAEFRGPPPKTTKDRTWTADDKAQKQSVLTFYGIILHQENLMAEPRIEPATSWSEGNDVKNNLILVNSETSKL